MGGSKVRERWRREGGAIWGLVGAYESEQPKEAGALEKHTYLGSHICLGLCKAA